MKTPIVINHTRQNLCLSDLALAMEKRLESEPKFAKCRSWDHSKWLQALVGEVGETADQLKKLDRGDYDDDHHKFVENVAKEMADSLMYLILLAQALEIDLGKATILKFNEVSVRLGNALTIGHDGQLYYLPED